MKANTQFRIDTLEELEEAYEMFRDKWGDLWSFKDETKHFLANKARFIIKDEQGDIYLDDKIEDFETIPSPLVKRSKPKQYADGIDTFERMEKNATFEERIAFAKGNIDKYVWRKKDQDKQDFEKIIKYAQWAIKQYE